ncbi:hypothetical protein CcCBS67573_g02983 [Chytriomyces confervae]|uniref:Leucine-rich repeat-containing N-terminal plant-type domain-containing protein n=1 Tax=Chytriomyces confervae TaxID=246404 RepID=A0A507FJ57_9FUNG|nr:hypothetical protein CcCBS67573_g02983 [Chytriomyces confervae]
MTDCQTVAAAFPAAAFDPSNCCTDDTYRVICEDGNVVALDMSCTDAVRVPSWSGLPFPRAIEQLTHLQRLAIRDCNLAGDLPDIWEKTPHLTVLDLSGNQLQGALPPSLAHLVQLTRFSVAHNLFTNTVPAGVGTLCPSGSACVFDFNGNCFDSTPLQDTDTITIYAGQRSACPKPDFLPLTETAATATIMEITSTTELHSYPLVIIANRDAASSSTATPIPAPVSNDYTLIYIIAAICLAIAGCIGACVYTCIRRRRQAQNRGAVGSQRGLSVTTATVSLKRFDSVSGLRSNGGFDGDEEEDASEYRGGEDVVSGGRKRLGGGGSVKRKDEKEWVESKDKKSSDGRARGRNDSKTQARDSERSRVGDSGSRDDGRNSRDRKSSKHQKKNANYTDSDEEYSQNSEEDEDRRRVDRKVDSVTRTDSTKPREVTKQSGNPKHSSGTEFERTDSKKSNQASDRSVGRSNSTKSSSAAPSRTGTRNLPRIDTDSSNARYQNESASPQRSASSKSGKDVARTDSKSSRYGSESKRSASSPRTAVSPRRELPSSPRSPIVRGSSLRDQDDSRFGSSGATSSRSRQIQYDEDSEDDEDRSGKETRREVRNRRNSDEKKESPKTAKKNTGKSNEEDDRRPEPKSAEKPSDWGILRTVNGVAGDMYGYMAKSSTKTTNADDDQAEYDGRKSRDRDERVDNSKKGHREREPSNRREKDDGDRSGSGRKEGKGGREVQASSSHGSARLRSPRRTDFEDESFDEEGPRKASATRQQSSSSRNERRNKRDESPSRDRNRSKSRR